MWVSEHHFAEDGYLPATMPSLAALAARTETVELGTCIALAPLYDGVRLAEDAATVDLLADGRLTMGLAIGSNPREFESFGVPREERVERMTDLKDLLRASWSEGALDYDAEFHDVSPDVSVTPKPESKIPIMFGGPPASRTRGVHPPRSPSKASESARETSNASARKRTSREISRCTSSNTVLSPTRRRRRGRP
jgi:alkanesulfonate monooxygenase SsuD/methylene tetrahydromethanopterin reductase-like flavin-dependent oxidoreductase (luciferase family)